MLISNENYSLSLSKSRGEETSSPSLLTLPAKPTLVVTPVASGGSSASGSDNESEEAKEEEVSPPQLRLRVLPKPISQKSIVVTPVCSSSDSESGEEDTSPPLTTSDED